MDCVDVRDRLTEYALSLLPPPEVAPVEQHLSWCAGCRKEAAELAGGAAAAAMSLPQADPPQGLEERIVREIRSVTGSEKGRKGRARSRTMIVLAATIAIFMGFGWWATFGDLQTSKVAQQESEKEAQNVSRQFSKLLHEFTSGPRSPRPRDALREIQLTPELGQTGGGKAVVFLSPDRDDWVLVYVGGLDAKAGPFGATIQSPDGTVLSLGQQDTSVTGGGVTLFGQFPESLKPFTRVVVTDRRGHVAMTGTVQDAAATPTTVD
jgi:hypothetical protein